MQSRQIAATSGYRADGDTGLSKVACRYYDSQTGTFTTRDTYLDQKPYLYCEHDPVNAVDPSGHQTQQKPPSLAGYLAVGGLNGSIVGVLVGGGPAGFWIGRGVGMIFRYAIWRIDLNYMKDHPNPGYYPQPTDGRSRTNIESNEGGLKAYYDNH